LQASQRRVSASIECGFAVPDLCVNAAPMLGFGPALARVPDCDRARKDNIEPLVNRCGEHGPTSELVPGITMRHRVESPPGSVCLQSGFTRR
jgi:hypothetical protein